MLAVSRERIAVPCTAGGRKVGDPGRQKSLRGSVAGNVSRRSSGVGPDRVCDLADVIWDGAAAATYYSRTATYVRGNDGAPVDHVRAGVPDLLDGVVDFAAVRIDGHGQRGQERVQFSQNGRRAAETGTVDAQAEKVWVERGCGCDYGCDVGHGGAVAQRAGVVDGEGDVEGLGDDGLVPGEDGAQLVGVGNCLEADEVEGGLSVEVVELGLEVGEVVDVVWAGAVVAGELCTDVGAPCADGADEVLVVANGLAAEADDSVEEGVVILQGGDTSVSGDGGEGRLVSDGHDDLGTCGDEVAQDRGNDRALAGVRLLPGRGVEERGG